MHLKEASIYIQHAVEESDPDEFHLCDSTTYETNTIEISDPDEFCLSEKIINNDNMLMTQTRHIPLKRQMKMNFCLCKV